MKKGCREKIQILGSFQIEGVDYEQFDYLEKAVGGRWEALGGRQKAEGCRKIHKPDLVIL